MAKSATQFVCQSCGHRVPKWLGKCPACEDWNSFAEERAPSSSSRQNSRRRVPTESVAAQPVTDITGIEARRLETGIGELDRVLGGGLVPGSLVLVGGDPGIGKSTLVWQAVWPIAQAGKNVLYVSGEESPEQIKLRAERLGCLSERILVCPEICVEEVLNSLDRLQPDLLVMDSIQTFFTQDLQSAPGSIGQVREVAFKIFQECKSRGLPVLLIGHITKEGALAGPKSLEHIVDTVLYFEGERHHAYRVLRSIKNRFGATPEIGVFEMIHEGLRPVDNPSEIFLDERPEDTTGSVIVATLEGSRPFLVEVQALVSASSSVGMPRRVATGIDYNRMTLLAAIMEKRLEMSLQGEDIFVNLAGGIKVTEPAMDLGVATAIASSFQNRAIDPKTVMIGEVGLTGEIRSVPQLEPRLAEAAKLGFQRCVVPQSAQSSRLARRAEIEPVFVKSLAEALEIVL
ncbi:MAG: DNA repair protein RadA [Nitrospinaceae bacterium]|nr:DNA repair protein RadA [Nitrospinaceae bacterium]NIR53511.1 DNA repair protein RadA [Nitrospinaceae bacterium]NIS83910.1 DNA repair protein RadA [Nitrospinaceae bacterium]NIT80718.1 DNA repair protein RadA [Nitrospinaceae bacterium]NIU43027.1 DNA repair protein RadA [Nitrospinaceae bacterium]